MKSSDITSIAFYLPQYYPIPENDKWWGKGFTEWYNVTRAKPLFRGHYQPRLPTDLGFYDLRNEEIKFQQVELATTHGINAFCFWHYWFGNNQVTLEKPVEDFFALKDLDISLCLAWANEDWTNIWTGNPKQIILEQLYPGIKDCENHFYHLLPFFQDERYVRFKNKLVFGIYKPNNNPYLSQMLDVWNNLASKEGLGSFYFFALNKTPEDNDDLKASGLNAILATTPLYEFGELQPSIVDRLSLKVYGQKVEHKLKGRPRTFDFGEIVKIYPKLLRNFDHPVVAPSWDTTARHGYYGVVGVKDNAVNFARMIQQALDYINEDVGTRGLLFVKSWNEWAEGNTMEPDEKYGMTYLETFKKIIESNTNEYPV